MVINGPDMGERPLAGLERIRQIRTRITSEQAGDTEVSEGLEQAGLLGLAIAQLVIGHMNGVDIRAQEETLQAGLDRTYQQYRYEAETTMQGGFTPRLLRPGEDPKEVWNKTLWIYAQCMKEDADIGRVVIGDGNLLDMAAVKELFANGAVVYVPLSSDLVFAYIAVLILARKLQTPIPRIVPLGISGDAKRGVMSKDAPIQDNAIIFVDFVKTRTTLHAVRKILRDHGMNIPYVGPNIIRPS